VQATVYFSEVTLSADYTQTAPVACTTFKNMLKNAGLDSMDSLQTTYTIDAELLESSGIWYFAVYDVAFLDTGHLDSWRITFP
jgi:hypothetical protein